MSLSFGYLYIYRQTGFIIECLIYKHTNLYCPACGITRCIFSLLEGNFIQAFKYNQLIFCMLPILFIYFVYKSYLFIINKKDLLKIPNIIYIVFLISFILFGIFRNINGFDFLTP